ncbi:C-X-C chemokine receptor type 2-like [Arapaima gigas]
MKRELLLVNPGYADAVFECSNFTQFLFQSSFKTSVETIMTSSLVLPGDLFQNVSFNDTDITFDPETFVCFRSGLVLSLNVQTNLMIIAFILGMVGNFAVLVFIGFPPYQRSLDLYLANQAVNDLLSALRIILWLIDANPGWFLGDMGCKVLSMLRSQSLYTGVLLLGGLCTHVINRANSHLLGISAWVFGFFLALPAILFSHESHRLSGNLLTCHQNEGRALQLHYKLLTNLVGFSVPLLLSLLMCITYFYLRNKGNKRRKKKCFILLQILAFTAFRSPFYLCAFMKTLMRAKVFKATCLLLLNTERATSVTRMLSKYHCFINPILYYLFRTKSREFFH